MENFIVLIPITYHNSRKVCEHIENMEFNNLNELKKVLKTKLDLIEDNYPQFFSLTDFMDQINDELFNPNESFISYIKIK